MQAHTTNHWVSRQRWLELWVRQKFFAFLKANWIIWHLSSLENWWHTETALCTTAASAPIENPISGADDKRGKKINCQMGRNVKFQSELKVTIESTIDEKYSQTRDETLSLLCRTCLVGSFSVLFSSCRPIPSRSLLLSSHVAWNWRRKVFAWSEFIFRFRRSSLKINETGSLTAPRLSLKLAKRRQRRKERR